MDEGLRIVSDQLWKAAHQRIEKTRQVYTGHRKGDGTLIGKPESGLISAHLLAGGFLRCTCGATMFVAPRTRNGVTRRYYECVAFHKGKGCPQGRLVEYNVITNAIVGHLDERLLDERKLAQLWEDEQARAQAHELDPARVEELRTDIRRLEGELGNLALAIAAGGQLDTLVQAIKAKERERAEVQALLAELESAQAPAPSLDKEALRRRVQDVRGYLESDTVRGRAILRE